MGTASRLLRVAGALALVLGLIAWTVAPHLARLPVGVSLLCAAVLARRAVLFDMRKLAQDSGTVINAVLFGVAYQLRGGIKAHRLTVQNRAGENIRIAAFDPGRGVNE